MEGPGFIPGQVCRLMVWNSAARETEVSIKHDSSRFIRQKLYSVRQRVPCHAGGQKNARGFLLGICNVHPYICLEWLGIYASWGAVFITGTPVPSGHVLMVHRENIAVIHAGSTLAASLCRSSGSYLSPTPWEYSILSFLVYLHSGFHDIDFLEPDFFFFLIYMIVTVCVNVTYMWYPKRPEEDTGFPRAGDRLLWDSWHSAENQTQVLCKSSKCS